MIVLCVAPDSGDLPRRVAWTLGIDVDVIFANAEPGLDHIVVGSGVAGTFAVPCTAESAAELLRSFMASGKLDPGALMEPPASVLAHLSTH